MSQLLKAAPCSFCVLRNSMPKKTKRFLDYLPKKYFKCDLSLTIFEKALYCYYN